ncbi:hypothetical protein [Streptomyces sp. NPDC047525]|uniref:hypothetical protein n=1 Tax=Streptomyces sp. NPDC047525 TaxID=3155264 RepID=UPI0033F2E4AC
MREQIKQINAEFKPGAHVTVTGKDTRGQQVTRTGYLLTEAAETKAKHTDNHGRSKRVPSVRLCVGALGTDPSERTTWVQLFHDLGSIQNTPEPEVGKWLMTELREVPGIRANSHTTRFMYGGKGGARSEPTQGTAIEVLKNGQGDYRLWDAGTDTVLATYLLSSKIWWSHLPNAVQTKTADATRSGS